MRRNVATPPPVGCLELDTCRDPVGARIREVTNCQVIEALTEVDEVRSVVFLGQVTDPESNLTLDVASQRNFANGRTQEDMAGWAVSTQPDDRPACGSGES